MEKDISYFYVSYIDNNFSGNTCYETRGRVNIDRLSAHINSNELTNHHRPHVHVKYEGVDYVCAIDNKIQIIHPKQYRIRIGHFICSIIANSQNLSLCRKEWNRCKTLIKFKDEEINFKTLKTTLKEDFILIETNI